MDHPSPVVFNWIVTAQRETGKQKSVCNDVLGWRCPPNTKRESRQVGGCRTSGFHFSACQLFARV